MFDAKKNLKTSKLYLKDFEHDNCGIGAAVNIKGLKSYETLDNALKIVENLEHRAGKDAQEKTGDGVGILVQISHEYFIKVLKEEDISLPEEREYGVGMFFFPQDELERNQAKKMFEIIVEKEGMEFLGWRKVPVDKASLGKKALECMPFIMQAFVKKPENVEKGLEFDKKLYIVRRIFEQSTLYTYVPSLSSRTIVYKGMFLVDQLRKFYIDLQSKDYKTAIAIVHSRFSTNTNPSWERAHPNRLIVHNGEINTIRGNADKMLAREENMKLPNQQVDLLKVLPVVNTDGSDSAMFDNTLEFLMMSGMDLPLAMMITIPEPWANNRFMSQKKKDFYEYYATMMEPWDGPASIMFCDGDVMGAVLDRNGLRPSRYYITKDDNLILSSEVGVLDIPAENILVKERLRPGKMLLVDTKEGKIIDDDTLKEKYASNQPYGEWLDNYMISLKDLKIPNKKVDTLTEEERKKLQKAFGYTYEEVKTVILPMAKNGSEAIAAMGVDTPIPVLSKGNENLSHSFKQLFAQVTNPPIDAIREEIITSTTVFIGPDGNLLNEKPENCTVLKVNNPILSNTDLLKIKNIKSSNLRVSTVPITYYKNTGLKKAIDRLYLEVDRVYREGSNVIILSDRGVDENHVAIPALLAVSALQRHLVNSKKRTGIAMILESAEPKDVHEFATLLGYGACAINPYLAIETIKELIDSNMLDKDFYAAVEDYNSAVLHGIVKIASKMGISTIQSYQGSQIFEAIGIDKDVINTYFTNTVCRIEGMSLKDIEEKVNRKHCKAFDPLGFDTDLTLDSPGNHKQRGGQKDHLYNPETIHLLQLATRLNDYSLFKQYSSAIDSKEKLMNLRSLLEFNYPKSEIDINEVESVESIVKRFKTGAMSYGSISKEAHETLAIAMNMINGKSNSGEGGESLDRLEVGEDGLNRCSAIKQVASGRFGVTSRYLVSAKEIQIKMAQGAKPGEGGHLPSAKVYPWVAKTRHSTPGVGLISPPPHHDIYSIEDLAQLIYDLKNANKQARISVKLVSETGVGTIAAGVAKAGAQVVLISGYDGGTGAAPKSSIHDTGLPWELGLAETHQTLIQNGLRERVRIEVDGKLMTGRDVAIAAILGGEEFGFATAPLVTMGCVMMRVCDLDTCPVGVATQNPELRKNFTGKPEYVVNFMYFIAQELREYMAKLGVRTLDELTGQTQYLKVRKDIGEVTSKVDVSLLLDNPYKNSKKHIFNPKKVYDFKLKATLDEKILLKQFAKSIEKGDKKQISVKVTNIDRTFGTILGAELTKKFSDTLAEDTYVINAKGSGGQSFGAFIPKGLRINLEGDSNDYYGKGLSGGKLVVYPPKDASFKAEDNIIIGNVAFYGATSGKAFINGVAGERFCVRNSGINAVVEGVGDHGLEYMTGGRVVILGDVGKNFAAGMSGGIAYVLDEHNELYTKINKEMVSFGSVVSKDDVQELKDLIIEHYDATGSKKAKVVLEDFENYLGKFKKVIPFEYDKMLKSIMQLEEKGLSKEEALIEAFYLNRQ